MVSTLRFFFLLPHQVVCSRREGPCHPVLIGWIRWCKDAAISCVERVSFLIVHDYNAEPFKALIGKYCIHLELQRKYIGKQSVITQNGIGPRLEIHTPANSARRFLMTGDDQASVSCLVQKATFTAEAALQGGTGCTMLQYHHAHTMGSTVLAQPLGSLHWTPPSWASVK